MIEISVKTMKKDEDGTHLECRGAIRGNGGDIRREMVGALQMFDEVAEGKILCDALEEFLKAKIEERMKGAEDDD